MEPTPRARTGLTQAATERAPLPDCARLGGRGSGRRPGSRAAGLRARSPAEGGERVPGGTGRAPHAAGPRLIGAAGLSGWDSVAPRENRRGPAVSFPGRRPCDVPARHGFRRAQRSPGPLASTSFPETRGERPHLEGAAHPVSARRPSEAAGSGHSGPGLPYDPGPLLGDPGTARAQPSTPLPSLAMSVLKDSCRARRALPGTGWERAPVP